MEVYKETEFLKKAIGPVLVSALAEVCVKRPADPIEFIGHWLLRWRYNEELKKRDMENAVQVVRVLQETHCSGELKWDEACGEASLFNQGITQLYPFLPPGYGGPLDESLINARDECEEPEEEYEGEGQEYYPMPKRLSIPDAETQDEEVEGEVGDEADEEISVIMEENAQTGIENQEDYNFGQPSAENEEVALDANDTTPTVSTEPN